MGSARTFSWEPAVDRAGALTPQSLSTHLTHLFGVLAAGPMPRHLLDLVDQLEQANRTTVRQAEPPALVVPVT